MPDRSKKARKPPKSSQSKRFEQLVRMRSPVRIWVASPQKPLFSFRNGGFSLFIQLFRLNTILDFTCDHRTSHRQKNYAPEPFRGAVRSYQPTFSAKFSRAFSAAISTFISDIIFFSNASEVPLLDYSQMESAFPGTQRAAGLLQQFGGFPFSANHFYHLFLS
jgi:hypothetical protein